MYPFISKLAKRYLCIPGTSVSAERVFSTAGDIITAQQSTLTPEHQLSTYAKLHFHDMHCHDFTAAYCLYFLLIILPHSTENLMFVWELVQNSVFVWKLLFWIIVHSKMFFWYSMFLPITGVFWLRVYLLFICEYEACFFMLSSDSEHAEVMCYIYYRDAATRVL